jgi:hypothetical protein
MESPKIWDFNRDGARPGSWWWWFWLFFWENPENPGKPKQLMILWSTKNDPKILCNGLVVDNHYLAPGDGSCRFGGVVGAWYFDGKRMRDEYVLGKSDMTVSERPRRELVAEKPVRTAFSEPRDGLFKVAIGDGMEFTAEVVQDDFSRLAFSKGVFFGKFDYRMTRMGRLELEVREKGSAAPAKGTAYFQKVMVNAPVPPWHWGIFHFKDHSLTYYRPFVGSALLSKNPFKWDPLRLNKGLKSSVKFHDHGSGKTYLFRGITVKTRRGRDGLPVFKVSCGNPRDGSVSFTVEPYAEAVWRFRKRIANLIFPSNVHYQEYPSRITELEVRPADGPQYTIADTGVGVGNAEDNAGFLI